MKSATTVPINRPPPSPTPKSLHTRELAMTVATSRGLRIPLCHISRHLQASLSSPTACHSQNRKPLILPAGRNRFAPHPFAAGPDISTYPAPSLSVPYRSRSSIGRKVFCREVMKITGARPTSSPPTILFSRCTYFPGNDFLSDPVFSPSSRRGVQVKSGG